MRHAGPEALARLEPFLEELRGLPGLVEKKPGVFYRRSHAFLHFHEDPTGLYADIKLAEAFERVRVETDRERTGVLRRIRDAVTP